MEDANVLYRELTTETPIPANEATATIAYPPVGAPPTPTIDPNPDMTIRVKIYRQPDNNAIKIETTPPLNSIRHFAVLAVKHLPKKYASKRISQAAEWYGLERAIQKSDAPMQVWADAIGEMLYERLQQKHGVTHVGPHPMDSAYVAMGDKIYRLSPVEVVGATKAMAVVRRRATDKAIAQAEAIVANARISADGLIASANATLKEASKSLEEAKRSTGFPPPRWAVEGGYVMRFQYGQWSVCFPFNFFLTHWDVTDENTGKRFSWEVPDGIWEKRIDLWLPINPDGAYAMTSLKVDKQYPPIPHISHEEACLAPGDAPKYIRSADDLGRLRGSVQRCLMRVDLSSLRSYVKEWIEDLKPAMPEDLYIALSKGHDWRDAMRLAAASLQAVEPEEGALWTVAF